jgi:erythronate-4-phosphate dehydrogenase
MALNLIVDESITNAHEAFSRFGHILYLTGRMITNSVVRNADALIVRSTTLVDEELLTGSNVKFVGTATIGTDHIDKNYLASNKIAFSDAKGCNADAVAEYFLTALFFIAAKNEITLKDKSIGIVGVGNIGNRVKKLADAIGLRVVLNDPPLKRETALDIYRPLDEVLECDIITIHTPLKRDGQDPTYHLFDERVLSRLKEGTILINSARGEVVDNLALLEVLKKKKILTAFDVFESEPNILTELINHLEIVTPHIAGYSFEGKINGTKIIYDAFCKCFSFKPIWEPEYPSVKTNIISLPDIENHESFIDSILRDIFPINKDDKDLREILNYSQPARGKYFDTLRKEYLLRREFSNFYFDSTLISDERSLLLDSFRFNRVEINPV